VTCDRIISREAQKILEGAEITPVTRVATSSAFSRKILLFEDFSAFLLSILLFLFFSAFSDVVSFIFLTKTFDPNKPFLQKY
jgi:hypothetical protein